MTFNNDVVQGELLSEGEPEGAVEDFAPRAVGTLVHQLLELHMLDLNRPIHTEQGTQDGYGHAELLLAAGVTQAELPTVLAQVQKNLNTALCNDSPLVKNLTEAQELHPEFALDIVADDGEVSSLRIDLWWRDASGQVFLLDYKTAEPTTTDIEAFEMQQLQAYRPTLDKYALALSRYLDEPVQPILYLLATQSWLKY